MKRIVLVLALASMSPFAFAEKHPKLSPELKSHQSGTLDVIVRFRNSTQNSAMKTKIAGKGGNVQDDLSQIHALHASYPASRIADLENDADVEYVSPIDLCEPS